MAMRIVIVDDHRILRDGMKLLLGQEAGLEVVGEASSAREAMECVERTNPDIVIVDIALPDESGVELSRRLRGERPGLRILILTGVADPAIAHEVMLGGANGFLRKEEAREDLVRAIRTVASGKVYLSPDAATALTEVIKDRPNAAREPVLNERELSVLVGVAVGKSYKEIASDLDLSVKSIETYRSRLVKKLGCSTRADLVRYAIRKGLVKA
jgi:DNA-binding NarL/FixJ family response regulator